MVPAFAFSSILGGAAAMLAAWPRLGAASILVAPLGGSATVLALGVLTALRRPADQAVSTDTMVAELRGALEAAERNPAGAPAEHMRPRRARG